ncbi:hypothetical protein [Leucobacter iarius]|uniref:DUF559 domain-containing protein n=1 Tax=Leucobacter iarius TaxID=333963 RepID=A0ABN2LH18_9MICO
MLVHRRFESPHRGVHRLRSEQQEPRFSEQRVLDLARAYVPKLRRGEAFSHTTALLAFGAPIRSPEVVHLAVPLPLRAARGRTVVGHGAGSDFEVVRSPAGLPCVRPVAALAQSAALLPLRELVVAMDHLVLPRGPRHRVTPLVPLEALHAEVARASGRGVRKLRAALSLTRIGAESRMETEVRLELVALGIDDLDLQVELRRADGTFIGRFDLVDRTRRRIIEYDGEQHRTDRAQYLKDLARIEAAREEGYRLLRLHREDLLRSRIAETRARLCRFLGREPRPITAELTRLLAER